MNRTIWVGFDTREASAFAVAKWTIKKYLTQQIPVHGLILRKLQAEGLYTRPIEMRPSAADRSVMFDVISDAPMSTQHANARFLVPHLAKSGWALFIDGDMLVRSNIARLFETFESSKAIYCVKHNHAPSKAVKMDGQVQTQYARKNWTSVIAFNCDHPANKALTIEMVNTLPGRDLHRLCWIEDDDLIGELPLDWNWLVRSSPLIMDPKIVHFTEGVPDMLGYENDPFAEEWRAELERWAE